MGEKPFMSSQDIDWTRIEDLEVVTSCDMVARIVHLWSDMNFTTLYAVDYTENKEMRAGYKHIQMPREYMVFRIDAMKPHKDWIDMNLRIGELYHIRNVRVKKSKSGELEGVLHADRQKPNRVNISPLYAGHSAHKEIQRRQQDEENPKSRANKKRKKAAAKEPSRTSGPDQKRQRVESVEAPSKAEPPPAVSNGSASASAPVNGTAVKRGFAADQELRNHLGELRSFIDRSLSQENGINDYEVESRLSRTLECLAPTTANDLNRCTMPPSDADMNLKPLNNDPLVHLHPKSDENSLTFAMNCNRFEKIGSERLSKPWLLTRDEKKYIQFPQGYEPFTSSQENPHVCITAPGGRIPLADPSTLSTEKSIGRRFTASLQIIDYHPRLVCDFVRRTYHDDEATGHRRAMGDRFEFWLRARVLGTSAADASRPKELRIWVPNASARSLFGTDPNPVLETRDEGVKYMRERLREMWGDLELLKCSFLTSEGVTDDDESALFGWTEKDEVVSAGPQIRVGLRKMRYTKSSDESAEPWPEVSFPKTEGHRVVLEGTQIVLDDTSKRGE